MTYLFHIFLCLALVIFQTAVKPQVVFVTYMDRALADEVQAYIEGLAEPDRRDHCNRAMVDWLRAIGRNERAMHVANRIQAPTARLFARAAVL